MGDNQHPESHPGASWELMQHMEKLCYITIIINSNILAKMYQCVMHISKYNCYVFYKQQVVNGSHNQTDCKVSILFSEDNQTLNAFI